LTHQTIPKSYKLFYFQFIIYYYTNSLYVCDHKRIQIVYYFWQMKCYKLLL